MSQLKLLWTSLFRRAAMASEPKPTKANSLSIPNKLYTYDTRKSLWCPTTSEASGASFDPTNVPSFSVLSWNVDFMAPLVVGRFKAALSHLEHLLSPHLTSPPPPHTIILLQEVDRSCFQTLLLNSFVREFYQLTDISSPQLYSTLTLLPKVLAPLVSSVSRIPFAQSRMQRDCLCVELDIPVSDAPHPKTRRFRIANTHLESLNGFGDTARPKQLKLISKLLTAPGVDGGLVAGDMNCISPSDQDLPERMGLLDAWITTMARPDPKAGVDETDNTGEAQGHTWGYQPRCKYLPQRLDKILTVGKLDAAEMQRVGVGLKVEGRDIWVSDHYGLLAKIVLQS